MMTAALRFAAIFLKRSTEASVAARSGFECCHTVAFVIFPEVLERFCTAGPSWLLPEDTTDAMFEARLFANAGTKQGHRRHVEPVWAAATSHRPLRSCVRVKVSAVCCRRDEARADDEATEPFVGFALSGVGGKERV